MNIPRIAIIAGINDQGLSTPTKITIPTTADKH
jgi:hypothetical protein